MKGGDGKIVRVGRPGHLLWGSLLNVGDQGEGRPGNIWGLGMCGGCTI